MQDRSDIIPGGPNDPAKSDENIRKFFSWVTIINSVNNGIVAVDPDGIVRVFNRAASKIFGWPIKEVLGKPIKSVIPNTELLQILETGEAELGRRFSVGDSVFLVNRTPIKRGDWLIGAVAVFQDITQLESIADELSRVKELTGTLEAILDHAYDGIIVVNAEGLVTMVNKAYLQFTGYKEEEMLGKPVQEVVDSTRLHVVLKTGKPEVGELQRINGQECITMRIPIMKDGRVAGAVGKIMFKNLRELNALANRVNSLRDELAYYKDELQKFRGARYHLDSIIGNSQAVENLKETIRRVARSASTVLIRGESGTGKELVAHALHAESGRSAGPFIKVNCAAVPENLLEPELFGYVDGAFEGAKKGGQIGKFELADQGTIFLDEIGDMPLSMQSKLLRVIQEKEIERVGDNRTHTVDVRVVAATNRNLEELIKKGLFREDLYYRLNVVSLYIPPLRDRREDIYPMCDFLIQKFNRDFGVQVRGFSHDAMEILTSYHWPGNVRELENVVERAFNVLDGQTIEVNHLPMYLQKFAQVEEALPQQQNLQTLLEQTEKAAILRALLTTNGNKVQAAQLLGISRAGLYQKIVKYNIGE